MVESSRVFCFSRTVEHTFVGTMTIRLVCSIVNTQSTVENLVCKVLKEIALCLWYEKHL